MDTVDTRDIPRGQLESFGFQSPMGRAGQPAELASIYVFLASQEDSYITSEVLGVTSGTPGHVRLPTRTTDPPRRLVGTAARFWRPRASPAGRTTVGGRRQRSRSSQARFRPRHVEALDVASGVSGGYRFAAGQNREESLTALRPRRCWFTPTADKLKERVGVMSEQTNLGVGNQEPDPATADNPPSDIKAGDQAREPEDSAAHRSDRLDAGISQEKNIDPKSPSMPAGDQGG